ncbi:MAG TPA: hypothetical protein V6D17_12220, partial [Candidatus Obscuribacterales bacterium]
SVAYNDPTENYHMFGKNSIDPETGKPYEFNLSNALIRPAYRAWNDNMAVDALLLGGIARPGMAIAKPWGDAMTKGRALKTFTVDVATGKTLSYYGSKLGYPVEAAATNLTYRLWGDVSINAFNYIGSKEYQSWLDAAKRPLTDEQLSQPKKQEGDGQPQPDKETPKPKQPTGKPDELPVEKPEQKPEITGQPENQALTGGAPM